ncbi:hypothetical protein JCM8097_001438 [Rhodosporidiobolus ruineniae]
MKLTLSTAALALLAAAPSAYAGLEDAKYSTVLTPGNFDSTIASNSEGTLVAFFAPWCGHCKNLEPVWTKIAQAFEGDDRCKVAHLNADESSSKPIAQKYGVSGYPTLKFIQPPSKGGVVEDYRGPRTEEALLEFLNEHCGTHKLPGGLLSDLAGRIPSLDNLASTYLHPTATRPALLSSASALASSLTDSSSALASYYLKLFTKFSSLAPSEALDWIEKERTRLGKLASKKGQVAAKKIEEARMKQNILAAFAEAKASASSVSSVASETIASVAGEAQKTAESVVDAASATASSAASAASSAGSSAYGAATSSVSSAYDAASSAGSSAYDAAASGVADAQASASSVVGEAGKTAGSVADEASKTAVSVTDKVKETAASATQRVKEEL